MDKRSDDESNMSLDSLEENFKRATSIKDVSEENVDTILVPFYEQDVLIKVPKTQKSQYYDDKNKITKNPKTYLMNKRTAQCPKNSYLQIFRKKNNPKQGQNNPDEHEIRSLSPEYGDTERESIYDDVTYPTDEFINTESYNEIYYEKLLEKEYKQHLENSFRDEVQLSKDFDKNTDKDKPSSISDTSLPRRVSHSPIRRPIIDVINNVKLGGLGPDMEKIKPRLERARSLQRYSEKVRLENRLKIYKKSIETEKDKRQERQLSPKQPVKIEIIKTDLESKQSSYLIKKSSKDKKSLQLLRKNYGLKSACTSKTDKNREKYIKEKDVCNLMQNKSVHKEKKPKLYNADHKDRAKNEASEVRTRSASQNKAINRESRSINTVPPVKISFTVNFEGIRPSSALKRLEEKHKMYQEKVKKFAVQKENL